MNTCHENYDDAYDEAQARAAKLGLDCGIEKMRQFGRTVYIVRLLPSPERSYGCDLRAERVTPNDPKISRKG